MCSGHDYSRSYIRGQGHRDLNIVRNTLSSKDAFTHQIWNFYFKEYRRCATDSMRTIAISSGKGHSDPRIVRETPSSQDASTHQIWDSYLK